MAFSKTAIIIGAGPAGLTAAYELLERTDIKPIILECNPKYVGGISKTVEYHGNRIDIGGHRFFSKSDRVMQWWLSMLPLEKIDEKEIRINYQHKITSVNADSKSVDPKKTDKVMLVRKRLSRIFFRKQFFPYPITLSWDTISKLGFWRMTKIGVTYIYRRLFPIKPEKNLEDFFLNRFGDELYKTFFKSYTEKVWGLPCREISPEWGAQRIKGLSVTKIILHYLKGLLPHRGSLDQKDTETSLIERFFYPKLGPGLMWETVADLIRARGGEILMGECVTKLEADGNQVVAVNTEGPQGTKTYRGDYVFSTMAIRELIAGLKASIPEDVRRIAKGLQYRDFMTVGLLLKKLAVEDSAAQDRRITDNWIYIHDPDVLVGRLQIFNNWSEYMVKDQTTTWVGMEYFCNEGDGLWNKSDEDLLALGKHELAKIGIINEDDVLDGTVLREKKAYPAYFGTYNEFDRLRTYVDGFENLFLIGRNGMHRYNNQDHSMLTAMIAVDNIVAGITDKQNLWSVNTEQEYLEKK
ncbi:MAG: NAD(P)/FAD-dependent oxidoreductase [Patescibacteria group bacterium]